MILNISLISDINLASLFLERLEYINLDHENLIQMRKLTLYYSNLQTTINNTISDIFDNTQIADYNVLSIINEYCNHPHYLKIIIHGLQYLLYNIKSDPYSKIIFTNYRYLSKNSKVTTNLGNMKDIIEKYNLKLSDYILIDTKPISRG
jgi:hypothetical protein